MLDEIERQGRHRVADGGLSTMEIVARAPELAVYAPPLWSLPAARDWAAQLVLSVVAGGAVVAVAGGGLVAALRAVLG